MNETINTAAQAVAETVVEAKETIAEVVVAIAEEGELVAKASVLSRMTGSTTGKVVIGVTAVAVVAAAGHYGWKKFQSYKAGKKAKAFCKKAAEDVKKAAETAAE